jgi:hypothetical protein
MFGVYLSLLGDAEEPLGATEDVIVSHHGQVVIACVQDLIHPQ